MGTTELIVMLTDNDLTIHNAREVFEACKYSDANYWGMKEKGLPLEQMKQLFDTFRQYGKTGVLEVVAYTEEDCLKGAKMAADCGCDMLLGTLFYDSVNAFCSDHNIKYMPFVGKVSGRPSVLEGTVEDILAEAAACIDKGAYGIDLLSYRYRGDAVLLSRELVRSTNAPVCIAGSIKSYEQLDRIMEIAPAFFTVGSAFWAHRFGEDPCEEINRVCRYVKQSALAVT